MFLWLSLHPTQMEFIDSNERYYQLYLLVRMISGNTQTWTGKWNIQTFLTCLKHSWLCLLLSKWPVDSLYAFALRSCCATCQSCLNSETHLELSEMPATDLDFLTIFGLAGTFFGLGGVCFGLVKAFFGLPWPSLVPICILVPGFPVTANQVIVARRGSK